MTVESQTDIFLELWSSVQLFFNQGEPIEIEGLFFSGALGEMGSSEYKNEWRLQFYIAKT